MSVLRVGVVSDTHGLLRPEVLTALAGVEHILHAGDVGDITILDALRTLAPVTAIRGNIDYSGPTARLPATEAVELHGCWIYMLHALDELDIKPETAGMNVVVYGHSHRPEIVRRGNVLYLNPGSCGPRRFSLPVTVAILSIHESQPEAGPQVDAELIDLL